jgi:hypothetical protein
MKFNISTDGKNPFIHGYFFDENGLYFRGEGLEHLSPNFFCQTDALAFLQEAVGLRKITLEEACELGRDHALLSLPEERPSGLLRYQKNEQARIERMVTEEGYGQLAVSSESRHSFKRFLKWSLPHFLFKIFFDMQYLLFPPKTRTRHRQSVAKTQRAREKASAKKATQPEADTDRK